MPSDAALDRARAAERSVRGLFGRRLAGLPGTHLAAVSNPARLQWSWNYWWQAHYLDALVDAGVRELRVANTCGALERADLAQRLLRSIRVRNVFRIHNDYYDDMAWLALAVNRLDRLDSDVRRQASRRSRAATRTLHSHLRAAESPDLGGGLFWNTTRQFKNVPATGPAAIAFAGGGDLLRARRLVGWAYDRLLDPHTGLFMDGIRIVDGGERLHAEIYTYNQGTMLGALLALGDDDDLARAGALVRAVHAHLTVPWDGTVILPTHGGGDGGLFTGITCRYLAQAAAHDALDEDARHLARDLVTATADALWQSRSEQTLASGERVSVFSTDPRQPAQTARPDCPLELSPQLQAWLAFEAAACLDPAPRSGPPGAVTGR
jgi:predicted alpha-1,6-mannanase (GH76 family)